MAKANTPARLHADAHQLHGDIPQEFRSEIPSTPKSLPKDVDEGKLLPRHTRITRCKSSRPTAGR